MGCNLVRLSIISDKREKGCVEDRSHSNVGEGDDRLGQEVGRDECTGEEKR